MRKSKTNQYSCYAIPQNEVSAFNHRFLKDNKKKGKSGSYVCYKSTDFPERMYQITCKVNTSRKEGVKDFSCLLTLNETDELTKDIISDVRHLSDVKDIRDQICICAQIKEKTLRLLKMIKVGTEENYQKACIHLFLQVISKNYAEHFFDRSQLKLLTEILEESRRDYVSEEKYFQLDEKVYNYDMNIFPEEE